MRSDGTRFGQNLTAHDLLTLDAAQQGADIVARLTFVKQLAEHLNTGAGGLDSRPDADDLNLVTDMDNPALNPAGGDRAATGDGEDILNRHQETACQCRVPAAGI